MSAPVRGRHKGVAEKDHKKLKTHLFESLISKDSTESEQNFPKRF